MTDKNYYTSHYTAIGCGIHYTSLKMVDFLQTCLKNVPKHVLIFLVLMFLSTNDH